MKKKTAANIALRALVCLLLPGIATAGTYYRSIGSAGPYGAGTVSVVNGSTTVVGSGVFWRTFNRGRGDRITISGVPYTILSVDAENELTLTQPYAGTTAPSVPYIIERKFVQLDDWVDCISDNSGCPGVSSPDLVADGRTEVGIVYKDSPFFMNTGSEEIMLQNLTTDPTFDITLTVERSNRHHGVLNTGVILDNANEGSAAILIDNVDYVTIKWIELHRGDGTEQIQISNPGTSNQIIVRNVIFYDDDQNADGIDTNSNETRLRAYNNIFYGLDRGVFIDGLLDSSTALIELYHNTLFNNNSGIRAQTSTASRNDVIFLNNNLAISNGNDFNADNPNGASSHNYSEDGSGIPHSPGGFGQNGVTPVAAQFVNDALGFEDLHITPGSFAENKGINVGVSDDIDGLPRVSLEDIGADEAVSSSARPVQILTSKSTDNQIQLEWQNPDFGPMERIEIRRDTGTFPLLPTGLVACTVFSPTPGAKESCADGQSPSNGTTYFYSAFVFDAGGNYSLRKEVTGIPFDPTSVAPEWRYNTEFTTLAPAGVGFPNSFLASQDSFFHAIEGGTNPTSGEWPTSGPPDWVPYRLSQPVQHRPVLIQISGVPAALLAAQDGRVYAIRADTGQLLWKSEFLGSNIIGSPTALVQAFGALGAAADKVFVGTADGASNALYILELTTGEIVGLFNDLGNPDNIGPVMGTAIDYPSGPVYFTSGPAAGGSQRTVWAVDVTIPSAPSEIWSDDRGPASAAPILYKGELFVGTQIGDLCAFNAGGGFLWCNPYGNGAVKAPIFPVWPYDTVVFTTNDELHSLQFEPIGPCGTPPCGNWTRLLPAGASPVLQIPGTDLLFVGLANGVLWELTINRSNPWGDIPTFRQFPLGTSILGGPAFDIFQQMLYVSDTSGKVHGIPYPIP